MSDEGWQIDVICTDRGQHKRTQLARVVIGLDDRTGRSVAHMRIRDSWNPPDPEAEPNGGTYSGSLKSYRFVCSRCDRHPSIDRDRWWKALAVIRAETPLTEVDISVLPF